MVDPPDYGNPPAGPDPRFGPGGQQPPGGQGPQQPPPGGPGPQYPPSGTQPMPQYQQGQAGQGPPPPGPPGGPYQSGAGAPPPKRRRTGLIIGIVIACVVLLAAIGLIAFNLLGDDEDEDDDPDAADTSEETTAESESEPETTGPPSVDEAVGLCLPYEPVIDGISFDLSTACESDEAFWTITGASDDIGGTVDDEGRLAEPGTALDVCGDDYASYTPGEPWRSWYFTYDDSVGAIEELYCVEAVGNPDSEGRLPQTPGDGDCFDDAEEWWTVECDSDLALYEVVDSVAIDPPEELDEEGANEASQDCDGGSYFWQLLDVEGRTATVLCGDDV